MARRIPPERTPQQVVEAGYDVIAERYTELEDRFDARFLWVLARAPGGPLA